ncbi:hypothetical protein C1N51_15650 [Vibrio campbellii]|nr:hypothetical protein C1N51_15650 [Vibrio campbellii]
MPFLISVSFSHSKSPHGWRLDLILRARRLECGFYGALTKPRDCEAFAKVTYSIRLKNSLS